MTDLCLRVFKVFYTTVLGFLGGGKGELCYSADLDPILGPFLVYVL